VSVALPGRSGGDARRPLPSWVSGLLGTLAIVLVWEVLAKTWLEGKGVPEPHLVVRQIFRDLSFMKPNVLRTLSEAGQGWLWGNLAALSLAFLAAMVPVLDRPLLRIAAVTYCLPPLAIGPILEAVLTGESPKIALAGLSVFFTTLVGAMLGLRSADRTSLDLVRAYGGGRWSQLVKVRLRCSLPALFAALRIAAPAAVLGAIIGEYLGGERGIGIALTVAQQGLHFERTWGLAFVAAALAGAGYALTALVGRLLTPWAPTARRPGR
jgi:ABC-type nitrate/sulfonate/bicarbonate transport system permease component